MHVALPNGDLVWVKVAPASGTAEASPRNRAEDVGLRDRAQAFMEAGQLPGFAEVVRGVVASVQQALEDCRPAKVTVEFGIEITARTGGVLSALADAGGSAQIKVTASWGREDGPQPQRASPGDGGAQP